MNVVMAVLIRGLWTFGAVVLTAAVLVIGGGAALTTNQPTVPTLYFMYAMNCTFTIQNDAGATVSQIPPGTYQVDIRTPLAFGTVPLAGVTDLTACRGAPQFQLTGPGVNIFTTMTAGCEADKTFPATFQAGQSYTAAGPEPAVRHAHRVLDRDDRLRNGSAVDHRHGEGLCRGSARRLAESRRRR